MAGFGDELLILRGPSGATDQSSAGNDGTLTNSLGVVANTDSGGVSAFQFNATNKRITFSSAVNPPSTDDWSFGCWYKTSQTSEGSLYSNNGYGVVAGRFDIKSTSISASTYRTFMFGNASPTSLVLYSTNVSNTNTWRLAVFTRSGNTFSIYDNGSLAATQTVAVTINTNPFTVGGRPNNDNNQTFSGLLDDIRRSNTVWTSTQIAAWYAGGRGYDSGSVSVNRRRKRSQQIIRGAF